MTEQERYKIATTVGFMLIDKQNVIDQYSNQEHPYSHEMWLLYMGLIESYRFQRS